MENSLDAKQNYTSKFCNIVQAKQKKKENYQDVFYNNLEIFGILF